MSWRDGDGWLGSHALLRVLVTEASRDAARLGHQSMGFGETDEPGVLTACCRRCWMTGTITLRKIGKASLAGALLNLRCDPPRATPEELAQLEGA